MVNGSSLYAVPASSERGETFKEGAAAEARTGTDAGAGAGAALQDLDQREVQRGTQRVIVKQRQRDRGEIEDDGENLEERARQVSLECECLEDKWLLS